MGWLSFKTCQMLFFKQIVANFVNLSFVRILLWASTDICKQCPFTCNKGETVNSNFHRNKETCFGWKFARPIQIEHGQFWTPDYSSEELPSHQACSHCHLLPASLFVQTLPPSLCQRDSASSMGGKWSLSRVTTRWHGRTQRHSTSALLWSGWV